MKAKLSLNIQHDYITLKTPNGNYTQSYGGVKATGKLAVAFNSINNFVKAELAKENANLGDVMQMLTNEELMTSLWPDWNKNFIPDIKVGDTVTFDNVTFLKKYPQPGIITEIKKKYAFINFPNTSNSIGFEMCYLVKC